MGSAQITDACKLCAVCVATCPTGSISKGNRTYVVDSDTCMDCLLCVPVCPTGAVVHPEVKPKARKKAR